MALDKKAAKAAAKEKKTKENAKKAELAKRKRAGKRVWYKPWTTYPAVSVTDSLGTEGPAKPAAAPSPTAAGAKPAGDLEDLDIENLDGLGEIAFDPDPTDVVDPPKGKAGEAKTASGKAPQGAGKTDAEKKGGGKQATAKTGAAKAASFVTVLSNFVNGGSEAFYAVQQYFKDVDPNDYQGWKQARTNLVEGLGKKLNQSVQQKVVTAEQAMEVARDAVRLINVLRLIRLEQGGSPAKLTPAPTKPPGPKAAPPRPKAPAAEHKPAKELPPAETLEGALAQASKPVEAAPVAASAPVPSSADDASFTVGGNDEMDMEVVEEEGSDQVLGGEKPLSPEEGGTVGGEDLPLPGPASSGGNVLGSSDSEIEIDFNPPKPDEKAPAKKDDLSLADVSDIDLEGNKK